MPNYILSRTSPPAHIYERKVNLGYGVKVDVSDAPTEPNKGKNMQDAKKDLDMVRQEGNTNDDQRGHPDLVGTPVVQGDRPRDSSDLEAKEAEEGEEYPPFSKQQV